MILSRIPVRNLLASTSTACYACLHCSARAGRTRQLRDGESEFSGSDNARDAKEVYDRYDELEELFPRGKSRNAMKRDRSAAPSRSPPSAPAWAAHKAAIKAAFPEGWNPPRKVARTEMAMIKRLHGLDPEEWSTPKLASRFKISPEGVRRILKSQWRPKGEVEEEEIAAHLERQVLQDSSETTFRPRQDSFGAQGRTSGTTHYKIDPPSRASRVKPLRPGFSVDESRLSKWST